MTTQSVGTARKRGKPSVPPTAARGPTRISWRDACLLLGMSKNTLYRMAKDRRIPAVPIGEVGWGFYRESLTQWRDEQLRHGLERSPP